MIPGRLIVVDSTYLPPVVPTDPKGLHEVTVYFVLENVGKAPLQVQRLRTSASSTMTSEPEIPCTLEAEQTIRVAMTATTHEERVTRYAWVETQSERVELKVVVDPRKMRAAVEAAKQVK